MNTAFEEEPWEADIGAMLGGLPPVEPPGGFIAGALDHRPMYAGRTMLGMLAVTAVAVFAVVATGAVGKARITPEVASLSERHDEVRADSGLGFSLPRPVETGFDMPAGFERAGDYAADDVEVAVYRRGEESVSIFVQSGKADWDELPVEGLMVIEGQKVWIDPGQDTTILQASGSVVTVIGLSAGEIEEVLAEAPRDEPGVLDRLHDTVNSIVGQLGFPDVG